MTKDKDTKKGVGVRPDPLGDLGLTSSAADLVNEVKEDVTGKKQATPTVKPSEEQVTPVEQASATIDIKSRFEELFVKNKDDKDNGTTVWLSKANKKKLDTFKFKSDGKYQLRPTVNAIIELFFENYNKK